MKRQPDGADRNGRAGRAGGVDHAGGPDRLVADDADADTAQIAVVLQQRPASLISRRSALLHGATVLGGQVGFGIKALGFGALGVAASVCSTPAVAGSQLEEPLADAVRNALRSAVHSNEPPEPVFASTEARLHYLRWKVEMNRRLVARRSDMNTLQQRSEFLQTLWYNCQRARLDIALVLGLIQVESNFRKFAVSSAGARGYMQVMPFWTRSIGDGDPQTLFHMQTNLRFGCVILRHYLDLERGDEFMALGRYNGSRGKPPYPNAVQGARRNWEFAG